MTASDALVEQYRRQVIEWLTKQYYFLSRSEILEQLAPRYMAPALHANVGADSAPLRRFFVLARDFEAVAGTPGSIVAPCRYTSIHAQPCICPFQWFRFHRGARRVRMNRALKVLSEAGDVADAAETLHHIHDCPSSSLSGDEADYEMETAAADEPDDAA